MNAAPAAPAPTVGGRIGESVPFAWSMLNWATAVAAVVPTIVT